MRASPTDILDGLLAQLGLPIDAGGGQVAIDGDDPIVDSRHRPAAAAAAALAAQGLGVAAIWKARSGQGQDVRVEARRAAVPGLQTINFMRQNGHAHDLFPRSTKSFTDFFRTKDGKQIYLLRTTLYVENLIGTLELLGCSYEAESMARAVARWDALELEEALAERRLIGVIARPRDEWLAHPQGQWLAARPPVEIEKIGDSAPEPLLPAARPLAGVRVLDFTHILAGPVTARMLAEQGADTLHVSAQHQMDPMRLAIDTGAGKRSTHLDIDHPGDLATLRRLADEADIFTQSWRPGSLDRHGLSAEALAERRPGIIYVSVSAYGSGGPWATRAGYEPVGQAACGLVLDEGSADKPKLAVTGTLNDYLAAYLGSAGVMAALLRRAREGGSYHVKVSLTRTSMWIQELGRLPEAEWPERHIPMLARDSDLMTIQSPFGAVTIPAPITRYSVTPGYFDRPPEPFGASLPGWLPQARG
ncbi:CoA transferase [Sphingomonas panacis]|uniref:CoA transferase n=1 Tax=Sphingomonas panacis TaxID=1560345 RepID=UPI000841138A|nr:CoA transferase [Sphingomonas panacis]